MSLLRSRSELALEGRGQLVGLVGEAGTGKSRLIAEFIRTLDADRTLVLPVGTTAIDDSVRTPPAAAALRAMFAIDPEDGAEAIRAKVATRLRDLDLEQSLLVPLIAFLNLAVDDTLWTALNPQQRARDAGCAPSSHSSRKRESVRGVRP